MQAKAQSGADIAPQPKPSVRVFVDDGKSTVLQIPQSHDDMMALLSQRRVLTQQLEEATDRRNDLIDRMNEVPDAAKPGFQGQLNVLNDRITQLESSLNVVSQEIAGASPVLASMAEERDDPAPDDHFGTFQEGAFVGGVGGVVGVTILFLITRWLRRKFNGSDEVQRRPALPADDSERLRRLENGIDAMAVEIERISEGQRFVTKLLSQSQAAESAPR
jgi:hypothetical protein